MKQKSFVSIAVRQVRFLLRKRSKAASWLGRGTALLIVVLAAAPAWADEILGVSLPAALASTITQGGEPNNADTYATPYVATQERIITSWKAEFVAGNLLTGCGLPVGIQLKVLRAISATILQVIVAGAVHNPKSILEARFGGTCPSFATASPGLCHRICRPCGSAGLAG